MKVKILAFLFSVIICSVSSAAVKIELPEVIGSWHMSGKVLTPLITEYNGENQGTVAYFTYSRNTPNGTLEVIVTEGEGTGNIYIPESVGKSKGLMSADADFEILEISGHGALIENQSYLPLVLAINVSNNITLTLESQSLNKSEIINIAEMILSEWNVTE